MPYLRRDGGIELARSIGHVPIVKNQLVQERLEKYKLHDPAPAGPLKDELLIHRDDLVVPAHEIKWTLAFDGSPQEVAVREEYPSTRVGYIQIAGVLVDLESMLGEEAQQFVDPRIISRSALESLYSFVLPGSNIRREDMGSVRDSWRAEVFHIFSEYSIEDLKLIDVLKLVVDLSDKHAASGGVLLARCSADDQCSARDIDVPWSGRSCPACGGQLYPTDALRLHEEVSEEGANLTSLGRLMSCMEHLTLVGYLRFFELRQLRLLATVGFVLDGPLALFGPQAWLHTPVEQYINSLVVALASQGSKGPVIVGIEKTGQFAEHGHALGNRIPKSTVMRLPDAYIFDHILTSRAPAGSGYGRDTYYGQKFFYRTARGQLLTLTAPRPTGKDATDPHNYDVLPELLGLLDRVGTALYQDAIIPIALAHQYAAIPLRTGGKVLKLLAQESLLER